jgi:hypothetical protein
MLYTEKRIASDCNLGSEALPEAPQKINEDRDELPIYHPFLHLTDTETVSKMIKTTFLDFDEFGEWTHMLMSGTHPTARPEDTVVAVENASGAIVSAVPCVPQVFSYGGILLPVMNIRSSARCPNTGRKACCAPRLMPSSIVQSKKAFRRLSCLASPGSIASWAFCPCCPIRVGGSTLLRI